MSEDMLQILLYIHRFVSKGSMKTLKRRFVRLLRFRQLLRYKTFTII